ncbi:unnamed protein product [Peniophora sp. CBMAI 1063]|nr:unnamed protein product [Peniophora sp. CBMAI 1063]
MDYTSRLPIETLCYMFTWAKRSNSVTDASGQLLFNAARAKHEQVPHSVAMAWIPGVTHVCSRWRYAALGYTSLWTDIPFILGLDWLRTFLERSGEASVAADWQSLSFMALGLLESSLSRARFERALIPLHYRRLRNLVVKVQEETDLQLFSCSWPMLEELNVMFRDPLMAPFPLLNHDLPRLRQLTWGSGLELDSSFFPYQARCMDSLTFLRLDTAWGVHNTSMSPFLDMLARMNNLEHLQLRSTTARPSATEPCTACAPVRRVQELPSLKTLSLQTNYYEANHMLSHFAVPPNAKFRFEILEPAARSNDMDAMFRTSLSSRMLYTQLAKFYQAVNGIPPFVAAELSMESRTKFHARLSRSTTFAEPIHTPGTGRVRRFEPELQADLEVECPVVPTNQGLAMLTTILSILAQDTIRVLALNINPHDLVTAALDNTVFRNVVALHFTGKEISPYFAPLTKVSNAGEAQPLPNLKFVAFTAPALSSIVDVGSRVPYQPPKNRMQDFLLARRQAKVPIRALYLGIAEQARLFRIEGRAGSSGTTHRDRRQAERDGFKIKRTLNLLEAIPEVSFIARGAEALCRETVYNEVLQQAAAEGS